MEMTILPFSFHHWLFLPLFSRVHTQHLLNPVADLHRRPGGRWDVAPAPHARGARTPRGAARPAAASASAAGRGLPPAA